MKPVREYSTLFLVFFLLETGKSRVPWNEPIVTLLASASFDLLSLMQLVHTSTGYRYAVSQPKKQHASERDKSNLIVLLVTMCATLHLKASLEIEARQCAYQDEGRGFERSPRICYRHFRRAPTPFQMAIIGRFHVFLPGLCPGWFLVGLFYFVRSRIRPANLYQLQLASGETFDLKQTLKIDSKFS